MHPLQSLVNDLRRLTPVRQTVVPRRVLMHSERKCIFGDSSVIGHPFGISVFGSTLLRVAPDSLTIRAAITRLEEKPSKAFAKAGKAEQTVTALLRKAPVKESGLSRISLSQEYRFSNNERRPIGYVSRIGLTVVISELDQI